MDLRRRLRLSLPVVVAVVARQVLGLLRQPGVEAFLGVDRHEAAHPVVPKAAQLRAQILTPLQNRVIEAIEEVAKEHGLLYVFDMSQGNPVYASEESLDMLPLVKTKLGL